MAAVQRTASFGVCVPSGGAGERSSDMRRALLGFASLSAALTISTPTLALDRALVGTPTAPHDRPDRAYPAWMRHNEGCPRQWYAADTLRC